MKNLNLYALANELNLGDPKSGTIRVPFGRWDFGAKKLDDGRTVFFVQELAKDGAERMAAKINAGVADGEKGVPVYWGHPDVPELAHKYPDKRAKGWIKSAAVEGDALVLHVEWLEENATDGFGWFSPYWGGPATDLGQGRCLKHLDTLTSVALINIPNIQEFRLANELQGGLNSNERTFAMPQHLIDLARRYDERVRLANEANYDESKHPRAEDGKWTSGGGGGGASVGRKTKSERSTDSFKRRMDEEGEVTELNELEAKYIKLAGGNPFDLSPEAEKALSDFNKKKADLQKRGIIEDRIRGAKPGEGYKHKLTTDELKRRTPVNMGDGRSSWTEEERKKFSDPTSHLKFVELAKRFDERTGNLANSIDANGMGHSDENGQFDGSGSGGGSGASQSSRLDRMLGDARVGVAKAKAKADAAKKSRIAASRKYGNELEARLKQIRAKRLQLKEFNDRMSARLKGLANEWDESKHPREEDGKFAPAGTATGIYSVDNWNKQFAEHRSNRSFWRKTEGPNEVLERLRHHTVSYRSRAAELRKSGSRGDKYMNGKFEADYLAQDRINNRESIVRVHKAAILAGYTYNPKTHRYE